MRAAQDSLSKCCCCLPLNIFGVRKLCIFMIMVYTFDFVMNMAVFIIYAMYGFAGDFSSSIYAALWCRMLLSVGVVVVSVLLLLYKGHQHCLYLAVWIVLVYIIAVLHLMVAAIYSSAIPGQLIRRYNMGERHGNAATEAAPDSALFAAFSLAQYFFFLATLVTTIYCWRCIFLMFLCSTLNQRPFLEKLFYDGRDSAARKRKHRAISELFDVSTHTTEKTDVVTRMEESRSEVSPGEKKHRRKDDKMQLQDKKGHKKRKHKKRGKHYLSDAHIEHPVEKDKSTGIPREPLDTMKMQKLSPSPSPAASPKWGEAKEPAVTESFPPKLKDGGIRPASITKAKAKKQPKPGDKNVPKKDEDSWDEDFDKFFK